MEPRRHNATRPAAKNWKCDECQSTFRRMDHMKRHVLTHHTAKKHVCSFCGSAFSRGDVLRRHWKSCKNRVGSGQAIPKPDRETREAEGPALGRNTSKASNSWDLGPATLYPSSTEVLRHKTALTQ
ncbi:hypothetical protein N7499_011832 [Penicillium canescens]|nr:hypothetical protein N7499_011832 [Penicillium canescens]